ncbi:MAG: serine/threonine-protein kinase [Nannocystaceae bacterium]
MPLDPVEICPDEDELLALLSGSSRDAERVRSHLDDCSDCATVVARLLQPERRRSALGRARAPGQHVDRYLLLQPLGQGAMGTVWLARDPRLRRRVALKLVRVGARAEHVGRRLRHEAQALARVVDPHVTAVFDVGTDGDDVFIAMEHVAGGTLRAWSNAAPRRWRELLPVFRQAALGLAAAHRAGLVHRDFKPEHVRVELDPHEPAAPPRVRVADFGLAWAARAALDDGDDAPEQRTDALLTTAAGTPSGTHRLVGTPAYMAPEQFAASRVDARTDQFAFCVALYEALCGRRPFAGDDLEALRQAVLEREPAPLPRGCAPRWLRALVHRGLARDPSRRHADMDAIAVALARGHARRGPLLLPLGAALLAAPWLLPVRGGGVARCEDRPQPAAAVTTALRDRIAALDDGTATAVAAVAQRRLDDYAAALHELDLSVCETQRDADDTAAARARACVDAAAREFDATVETLGHHARQQRARAGPARALAGAVALPRRREARP